MTKVHPNSQVKAAALVPRPFSIPGKEEVLTVWRKSLLVNCSGFTVFDCRGDLVFRVDNYVSSTRTEIVLMDASGKPLLTVRHKRLSFNDNWQVFDGDSTLNPLFAARKQSTVLNKKCLAQIITPGNGTSSPPSSPSSRGRNVVYEVEGSYTQRCCAVYNEQRRLVAEIRRKEAVGNDVFRLIVQPEMSSSMAMAVVILLDQMFGRSSRRP